MTSLYFLLGTCWDAVCPCTWSCGRRTIWCWRSFYSVCSCFNTSAASRMCSKCSSNGCGTGPFSSNIPKEGWIFERIGFWGLHVLVKYSTRRCPMFISSNAFQDWLFLIKIYFSSWLALGCIQSSYLNSCEDRSAYKLRNNVPAINILPYQIMMGTKVNTKY